MKFKKLLILGTMTSILSGCFGGNDSPSITTSSTAKVYEIDIKADIYFGTEFTTKNSEKEKIKQENKTDFIVGEIFYVYIDFTAINNSANDEIIDFSAQLWDANYISTYDFKSGPIESSFHETTNTDDEGVVRKIVKITDMQFGIKTGKTVPFSYCFSLVPLKEAENLEFQIFFTSKYGKENYYNDHPEAGIKTYNFIENSN